jgi:hypothetical protein
MSFFLIILFISFPTLYNKRVGFSPEPHLHFAAYRSSDPTAPTVRVYFEQASILERHQNDDGATGKSQDEPFPKSSINPHQQTGTITPSTPSSTTRTSYFLPKAGRWYNHTGEVKKCDG